MRIRGMHAACSGPCSKTSSLLKHVVLLPTKAGTSGRCKQTPNGIGRMLDTQNLPTTGATAENQSGNKSMYKALTEKLHSRTLTENGKRGAPCKLAAQRFRQAPHQQNMHGTSCSNQEHPTNPLATCLLTTCIDMGKDNALWTRTKIRHAALVLHMKHAREFTHTHTCAQPPNSPKTHPKHTPAWQSNTTARLIE